MDVAQEVMRIDIVLGHQPGERRPMLVEVAFLNSPRLDRIAAEQALDIPAHALVDQLEQLARGRIEAIVEVEDPVADVGEAGIHGVARLAAFDFFSKMKA